MLEHINKNKENQYLKNIEKLSIKYPEDKLFLSLNDINKKRSKLIKNASGVIDQNS